MNRYVSKFLSFFNKPTFKQSKDEDFKRNSERKTRLEGEVKSRKQEQGKVMREMTFVDADIQKKEKELNKKRPRYIKVIEKILKKVITKLIEKKVYIKVWKNKIYY